MSRFLERELQEHRKSSDPAEAALAKLFAGTSKAWRQLYGDIPFSQTRADSRKSPEQLLKPITFSERTREVLISDGAVLYLPESKSLKDQKREGRSFRYIVDASSRGFLTLRARPIEVAIYPDPERFFVPKSSNIAKSLQEELQADDARALRQKLGVEDITEIMPEVSEATEVIFEHYDKTGVRLLGMDFRYLYMKTNTPTNKSGSNVAIVGGFDGRGPSVHGWDVDGGIPGFRAARWIVSSKED